MLRYLGLALCLLLLPLSASGGRREAAQSLQAEVSERGWVLSTGKRRARVEALDGVRQSFRLRKGERWLGLTEVEDGWLASGIRVQHGRVDLALAGSLGRRAQRVQLPAKVSTAHRTRPTPLVSSGGLEGLAWLEGADIGRLSVRVAAFEGGSFTEPTTVSPAGSRSQTGLSGVVLADGTWLLVWSRFDGDDDDLFWSTRRADGSWTRPRRIAADNSVPDITPHLLARDGGALLAWSRLEGEYEVVTAAFDGATWTRPTRLGITGGLSPQYRRLSGRGEYLLVRNAWPAGWTALHLDAQGRPVEFAVVAEESAQPPVLRAEGGSALAFQWPHRQAPARLEWEPLR